MAGGSECRSSTWPRICIPRTPVSTLPTERSLHTTPSSCNTRVTGSFLMRNLLRATTLTEQRAVSPAWGPGPATASFQTGLQPHVRCSLQTTRHSCHLSVRRSLVLPQPPRAASICRKPFGSGENPTPPPNSGVPLHRDGGTQLVGSPWRSRSRAHFLSAPGVEASTVAGGLVLVVLLHFKP